MNTLRLSLLAALSAAVLSAAPAAVLSPAPESSAPASLNQGPHRIEILKAIYGPATSGGVDVTYELQGRVNNGERVIFVGSGSLCADPAPGYPKSLWITYRIGNRKFHAIIDEGSNISFG